MDECEFELSIAYSGGAYCTTHRCHPNNCHLWKELKNLDETLKTFFSDPELSIGELKALSKAERRELAEMAAHELGVDLDPES